jgi:hypothetical protein
VNVTVQIQAKAGELNQLAAHADGLQKRYTAHLMLYEAACMAGNEDEIKQRREECHTLLDDILDNTMSVQKLSRELRVLMNG